MARIASHIASRTATSPQDRAVEQSGAITTSPIKPVLPNFSKSPSFPAAKSINPPYRRGRTVVILDGTSLFYSVSQLGFDIDYTKLIKQITQGGQLLRALFYTGIDSNNEKQKGFLHWMRHHGFRVIDKELNHLPDGSKKANLEVEMAIDMMQLAPYCDTIILVSGNGEMAYALDSIAKKGVHVEVVSIRSMLSDKLRDVCDFYTDLTDLQEAILSGKPKLALVS